MRGHPARAMRAVHAASRHECFDLFSAGGPMPRNLADVAEREKDIRYSSRTRMQTDLARRLHTLQRHAARLIAQLPPRQRGSVRVIDAAQEPATAAR